MNLSLYGSLSEFRRIEEGVESELGHEFLVEYIKGKVDNVALYSQSIDDSLFLIEKRIAELKELKEKTENKKKRFDDYVLASMKQVDATTIQGDIFKISRRKGRESVEVYDINLLPVELLTIKTTTTPDKIKIKELIKNGEEIQGAKITIGEETITYK